MSSEHLVHEIKGLGMTAYHWQYMNFFSNRFYGLGLIIVQFQKKKFSLIFRLAIYQGKFAFFLRRLEHFSEGGRKT